MLIIFNLVLMVMVGRCTLNQIETKTVVVGKYIRLICADKSLRNLVWIRLVPGKLPEDLGRSFNHSTNIDPRITTQEETGGFVLRIENAKQSDAGIYCCLKKQIQLTFLKRIDVRVEGPEPDITTVPPSDPVRPEDTVTLQCSAIFDSEEKTCLGDHSVYWLRVGPHGSHPNFNSTQRNCVQEKEKNHEGLSEKKCVYSFSKTVNSSDDGIYYCVVATCGEMFYRNASKSEVNMRHLQKDNTVLHLLCAALAISLLFIAFLIYFIKKLEKKACGCCNEAVALQTIAAEANVDHQSQTDEESLVYSAPTFTSRRSVRAERRDTKTEEESIYSNVKALGSD